MLFNLDPVTGELRFGSVSSGEICPSLSPNHIFPNPASPNPISPNPISLNGLQNLDPWTLNLEL